jgi:hypothetical protein
MHAGSNLDIWREIEGQRAIHCALGQGTVVKVAKGNDIQEKYGAVRITIRFRQPSQGKAEKIFAGDGFAQEQYFSALTLPGDLFRQLEPELPRLEEELKRAREVKTGEPAVKNARSPADDLDLAWSSLQAGSLDGWHRLPQAKRELLTFRSAKENKNLPDWKLMEENESGLLVKCALLLLWAKYNPSQREDAFKKAHKYFQDHIIEQAWNSTEPLQLHPLLPGCRVGVVQYCEGRPWPTHEDKESHAPRASRAYCPRERTGCSVLRPSRTHVVGKGFHNHSYGAQLYAECSRPWKEWSLLELLESADVVPHIEDLQSPDEYVPKLAGWVNRLNEIRERLKCSVCGRMMTPNVAYAKFLAKFNVTVVSCQYGESHDKDVYLNECWACGQVIDNRESTIKKDGYYICIHCGSGPQQSDDYTQGDICPKCEMPEMIPKPNNSRILECRSCKHTIKLPQERKLTGQRLTQLTHVFP